MVSRRAVVLSLVLKDMLDDDDNEIPPEIPVIKITDDTLKKVVDYCEYHVNHIWWDIQKPIPKGYRFSDIATDWDCNFLVNESRDGLFDLLNAADFLNIPSLLNLVCAKIALEVRGKGNEVIRGFFGLKN